MSTLKRLASLEDLEDWIERSRRQPVWVFKHSLTCGASEAAYAEYRGFAADDSDELASRCAVVEVQTARAVSDELARRTGVRHESPQALLLRDGEAVWHASHTRIRGERLRWAAGSAAGAG